MHPVFSAWLLTCCLVPSLWQRYIPFRGMIDRKKKRILFALDAAVLLINIAVVQHLISKDVAPLVIFRYDCILFGLVTTLLNVCVTRGRFQEHFFAFGIVILINYIMLSLPVLIVENWWGVDSGMQYVDILLIYLLLLLAVYIPVRKLIRNTVSPFLELDSSGYWGTIWFIPVALFLAVLVAHPDEQHIEDWEHLLSRALIAVVTILMCYSISADHKRLRDKQHMLEQMEAQRDHYTELAVRVEDARKAKHDFKHHIAAIRHYMDVDDKEGLREYCDDLFARNVEQAAIPYSGNNGADGVLYSYMRQAAALNIRFAYAGTIRSDGIADMDLCILLGNALDNAQTGCLTLEEDRWITVKAWSEERVLSILVRNSFDGVVRTRGELLLSRKGENRRGVGLASMQAVCDRYGGTLSVQWEGNVFTTMLLLPIESK